MSDHESRDERAARPIDKNNFSSKTPDVMSTASAMAGAAADKVMDVTADTIGTVSDQVTGLLNRQIGSGADLVAHVARSADRAAEELKNDAPQLADIVRSVAGKMERYADGLRDQSVGDLVESASLFTRRQPAIVFGAAAVAGFFAIRMIKSASPIAAPSIQPENESGEKRERKVS
jgi:hypothetical protein